MAYTCDFCGKDATLDHKIICKRCYDFLSHLLTRFEEPKERRIKSKKKRKNQRIKKSKKTKSSKEIEEKSERKTERQKKFEEFSKKRQDPIDLLTKCATCELSFLDPGKGKISCTDGEEPKTCGR